MDDEVCSDETLTGNNRFKVDTFIRVLDEVYQQLNNRFSEQNIAFMNQLRFFTPSGLLSNQHKPVCSADIDDICDQYSLNTTEVFEELLEFRETYLVCSRQASLAASSLTGIIVNCER